MKLSKAELGAAILDVTLQRFYELVRTNVLPPGVVVRLGRQVKVDEDALREWIKSGGQALPGGWRREPEYRRGFDPGSAPHRVRATDQQPRDDRRRQ